MTRQCAICQENNPATAPFCIRCNNALDPKAAYHAADGEGQTHALVLQLCRVLVERGLLDEAAIQVHDARIGRTLQALATRAAQNQPQ